MAINKSMRRVLKALSFDGIEVEASRHLANLKAIDPMKIFYKVYSFIFASLILDTYPYG